MARRSPIRISRRSMLAASGATVAAGALAACGSTEDDEDVSPEREAELLNQVLEHQLSLQDAIIPALKSAPAELEQPLGQLIDLREASGQALEKQIRDLGGTASDGGSTPVGGESAVEGVARQLEHSIAGSLAAIGELTPQTRLPVHQAIAEDAATLAAIRDTLGEELAPDAFVMGPPADRDPS